MANESDFDDEAMVNHMKEVLKEMSLLKEDDDGDDNVDDCVEENENGGIDDDNDEMDASEDEKMDE